MNLLDCCRTSVESSVKPQSASYFVETSRRNPLGKDLIFYECSRCETRWVHETLTYTPFTETWTPLPKF